MYILVSHSKRQEKRHTSQRVTLLRKRAKERNFRSSSFYSTCKIQSLLGYEISRLASKNLAKPL